MDDLKTVITQLRKDGFMPFCLFGHSRGANDVLIYSSKFCKNGNGAMDGSKEDVKNENGLASVNGNEILKANNDEVEKEVNPGIKLTLNLKLPKTTEEMKLEKDERGLKTPTSITTTSSSALLSELSSTMNKMNFDKVAVLSESEVEKQVVILEESKFENDDNWHILDDEKLVIVVAAPRFNMPKMLTTLFTVEQIEKLDQDEKKFEWQSNEKGKKSLRQNLNTQ